MSLYVPQLSRPYRTHSACCRPGHGNSPHRRCRRNLRGHTPFFTNAPHRPAPTAQPSPFSAYRDPRPTMCGEKAHATGLWTLPPILNAYPPPSAPHTAILTKVRTQSRRRGFPNLGNSLRRRLGPGLRRDDGGWGGNFHKTYPRPSIPSDNALGFRDGRHGPCHLCPETSGACPRLGDDIPMLRQGVRPGRGALNDRPHLPGALESGWRQPGKTPQAGCRGHHGHRRPATRTPRCPPASRFLPPPPQSRAEPDAHACTHHRRQSAARLRPPSCQESPNPDSPGPGFRVG